MIYYNSTKLLTLKDIDGKVPEIYMTCGNRTGGKTFNYKRLLFNKFLNRGEKFCWLVRFAYEMDGIDENLFKDIGPLKYPGKHLTSKPVGKNLFKELYLDGEACGYCVPINSADTIKKYSARLSDVCNMYLDEFMSENTKYCPDEIRKLMSIHTSIARGGGSHIRRVPLYMSCNAYTLFNPYFVALGVTRRIQPGSKFVRGKGWVLEFDFNEEASHQYLNSAFAQAFSENEPLNRFSKYQATVEFVMDSNSFIRKVDGPKYPILCVVYNGSRFGFWVSEKYNCYYISKKYEPSCISPVTFNDSDHNENIMFINRKSPISKRLSEAFDRGMVFFEDYECKTMFLEFMNRAMC